MDQVVFQQTEHSATIHILFMAVTLWVGGGEQKEIAKFETPFLCDTNPPTFRQYLCAHNKLEPQTIWGESQPPPPAR